MSERIHALARQLLGRLSVGECTLDEVKGLVNKYPYFAAAQFLLLEKLKQSGLPEYSDQLQKAVLYYHDPLEFEYFISSDHFTTEYDLEDIVLPQETTEEKLPEAEIQSEPEIISAQEMGHVPASSSEMDIQDQEPVQEKVSEEPYRLPVPPATSITFEPYHTVDYFASQGIKLSQEEIPKDKFGKQLKSFTEWLKTMKRLPPKDMVQSLDSNTESNVQHLAAHSVDETDVITESMAEVWIKQGNIEKALEVYNKLSLLNPSKMAYFAAKIENLKH
jgi:hypothetical protein